MPAVEVERSLDYLVGVRCRPVWRRGASWLKTLLVQVVWCGVRTKGTYLQAQFQRLKARRGPKKAIMAIAASMLTAMYFMLHPRPCGRTSFHSQHGPHSMQSGVSLTAGGTCPSNPQTVLWSSSTFIAVAP